MSNDRRGRAAKAGNVLALALSVAMSFAAVPSEALAAAASGSLPNLKGKSLIFAGFGGDLQKNEDYAWLKPFAVATGVKISQTDSPDLARLQLQQQAKNVGVDVVEIESSTVNEACGKVFVPLNIDRSQIDPALDSNKCGVPVVKFSYVLAYNSKAFPTPPSSVADFFDVKKFPGRRGAVNSVNKGLIEAALIADGVPRHKLYPVDIDRALKKISDIKSSVDFKGSFALVQDALASGELSLAVLPNGRALNAAKTNPDIKVVFKDAVTLYDDLAIPVGAKNMEAATAFLQYVARHATQVALAERFPYGVGTKGPAPQLGEQARAFYPDTYSNQILIQDPKWWAANEATAQQRWVETFSK
ncbi:extracellular solute-binding protein [Burkholderia stabilis]|uniref:Spermidine/putrescine ABC transporter periplasmic substrate-binding protein,ABC-type uncharacterized transport system, periplasmic component,Bacterial extracellular solute-binding protein n=1 Tax=Burkholderia stabilis TaxID=95485 RepID=A0AAJ5T5H1_9BURK|nr:extracellular solute-binding protein [Burkholderia stabilis]VBB13443.1 spermidine/putrescine ABC transporter periplasmic substrate-binding protein,ABC-type uncharacterized transport system, periplasmic component,Bacterial extracellular solute-binding protein [Burkholderia stabilis]